MVDQRIPGKPASIHLLELDIAEDRNRELAAAAWLWRTHPRFGRNLVEGVAERIACDCPTEPGRQ